MEKDLLREINLYLVDIFNQVLIIEESSLQSSDFSDLSVKEMHTIEAIGLFGNTTSGVAKKLRVTAGTVSVSIRNLVKKEYVIREADPNDRRVITLKLTKKGKLLYRLHAKFHHRMVERSIAGMKNEEATVLIRGLKNLYSFLQEIDLQSEEEL